MPSDPTSVTLPHLPPGTAISLGNYSSVSKPVQDPVQQEYKLPDGKVELGEISD